MGGNEPNTVHHELGTKSLTLIMRLSLFDVELEDVERVEELDLRELLDGEDVRVSELRYCASSLPSNAPVTTAVAASSPSSTWLYIFSVTLEPECPAARETTSSRVPARSWCVMNVCRRRWIPNSHGSKSSTLPPACTKSPSRRSFASITATRNAFEKA